MLSRKLSTEEERNFFWSTEDDYFFWKQDLKFSWMWLFREIIRNVGINNPSEAVVVCLIRAGMVFDITEIWKAFIEKRDLRGNIATSIKEAKQKISTKSKATKQKTIEGAV